jgi:O-methyltransferase
VVVVLEFLASLRDRFTAAFMMLLPGSNYISMARTVRQQTFIANGLITSYHSPYLEAGGIYSAWDGVDSDYKLSHFKSCVQRIYTTSYLAYLAETVDGDFVELGVFWGICPKAYLDSGFGKQKTIWLFDVWGDSTAFTNMPHLPKGSQGIYQNDIFERVQRRFSEYSNVRFVRGYVLETLNALQGRKVAFLSLDMNSVDPEIAALEALWDQISLGGTIYLDDFGEPSSRLHRDSIVTWMESRGQRIFCLPSGIAFVVKR